MQTDPPAAVSEKRAASILVRINARAWGVATGAVIGLVLFVATLVLVWKGGPDVGSHLGRLAWVLPGYSVSTAGAFVGLVYGFFIGYGLGRILGPRRDLANAPNAGSTLHVRLSARSWGITLAVLLALGLFLMTNALALRGGEHTGELLGRLKLYFPGYSVDFTGSLIGCAYMSAVGWIVGRSIAFVYNRSVARAES